MIKEVVEKYRAEQVEKRIQFYKDNPGLIMNNHDIRISTCDTILKGDFTLEELKVLRDASLLLWKARTGISGWYVSHTTYDDIIKLCEKYSTS